MNRYVEDWSSKYDISYAIRPKPFEQQFSPYVAAAHAYKAPARPLFIR